MPPLNSFLDFRDDGAHEASSLVRASRRRLVQRDNDREVQVRASDKVDIPEPGMANAMMPGMEVLEEDEAMVGIAADIVFRRRPAQRNCKGLGTLEEESLGKRVHESGKVTNG